MEKNNFSNEVIESSFMKGIFPHEHVTCKEKLVEKKLPPKEKFIVV